MKTSGLGASLKPLTTSTACFVTHLRWVAAKVSLHTILLGKRGTIYSPYSLEPLKYLRLDPQKVTKLAVKLHAHSVQYAYKLVSTRHTLEEKFAASYHQDQEWGTASHPPDPHWLLLFSLVVAIRCLGPRWQFFLNWCRECFTTYVAFLFFSCWHGRLLLLSLLGRYSYLIFTLPYLTLAMLKSGWLGGVSVQLYIWRILPWIHLSIHI